MNNKISKIIKLSGLVLFTYLVGTAISQIYQGKTVENIFLNPPKENKYRSEFRMKFRKADLNNDGLYSLGELCDFCKTNNIDPDSINSYGLNEHLTFNMYDFAQNANKSSNVQ